MSIKGVSHYPTKCSKCGIGFIRHRKCKVCKILLHTENSMCSDCSKVKDWPIKNNCILCEESLRETLSRYWISGNYCSECNKLCYEDGMRFRSTNLELFTPYFSKAVSNMSLDEKRVEINRLYGRMKQKDIAKIFGISKQRINQIILGK